MIFTFLLNAKRGSKTAPFTLSLPGDPAPYAPVGSGACPMLFSLCRGRGKARLRARPPRGAGCRRNAGGRQSRPRSRAGAFSSDAGSKFGAAPPPFSFREVRSLNSTYILQDNADQPRTAFIDDPLDGLLQLHAGIGRHSVQLVMQSLVYQLVQRLSENIALPDL